MSIEQVPSPVGHAAQEWQYHGRLTASYGSVGRPSEGAAKESKTGEFSENPQVIENH